MTDALKSTTILMPDNFNWRAEERIIADFDAVTIAGTDPSSLSADVRERVRGLAAFLSPDYIPLIDALPNLEIVANFGVGYDPKSSLHAIGKGIPVTHTPTVLDEEVADTALGLLLNTVREFYFAEKWLRTPNAMISLAPLTTMVRAAQSPPLNRDNAAEITRKKTWPIVSDDDDDAEQQPQQGCGKVARFGGRKRTKDGQDAEEFSDSPPHSPTRQCCERRPGQERQGGSNCTDPECQQLAVTCLSQEKMIQNLNQFSPNNNHQK